MAAGAMTLTIEMRLPWWAGAYINTPVWFCITFGTEPDVDKCARFLVRHSTFWVCGRRLRA